MAGIRVGVVLPVEGDVAPFAQHAEQLGYDHVAAPEHVAYHGAVPNPFVWLAAAAGATTSIQLVSTVILAPLYPAVVFAKLVASLDYVSGGRFSVGVGVGGEHPEEFHACGVPLSERGARTDEVLEILHLLLNGTEPAAYAGKWTAFDGIRLSPRLNNRRPPVWVGGRSAAAIRRAARYGDLWMPYMFSPEETAAGRDALRAAAERFGRDPEGIGVGVYLFAVVDDGEDTARAQAVDFTSDRYRQDFSKLSRKFLLGPPKTIARRMSEYIGAGASTFILEFACTPERCRDQMERCARELLPLIKE